MRKLKCKTERFIKVVGKNFLLVAILLPLFISPVFANEFNIQFLEAVRDNEGKVITKKALNGKDYPVFKIIELEDKRVKVLRPICGDGFLKDCLALLQYAKNFVISNVENTQKTIYSEPIYFELAKGGNYGKQGFWFFGGKDYIDKTKVRYVSISHDKSYFEKTVPHENAHVVMFTVIGKDFYDVPQTFHTITAISNYFMAFSEGYAESFEVFLADNSMEKEIKEEYGEPQNNYNIKSGNSDYFFEIFDLIRLSQPHKRYTWVKDNRFIFQKAYPQSIGRTQSIKELLAYYHVDYCFLSGKLKNAQQMLSSEGLISTLFYRIMSDGKLKNNYLSLDFYNQFLGEKYNKFNSLEEVKERIPPFLNINFKIINVFWKLSKKYSDEVNVPGPLMLEFIKLYGKEYPDEKEEIYLLFLETTKYVTSLNGAANKYYELDKLAHVGNFEALAGLIRQSIEERDCCLKECLVDENNLCKYVGPEIWIKNNKFKIFLLPPAFSKEKSELFFNLNTASFLEFLTIPGITIEDSKRIIVERDKKGYFESVDDLRGLMPSLAFKELKEMREAFVKALE